MMIPKMLTIHCSDSKNGVPVTVAEITRWHVARGFLTIGYHFVIQPDGTVDKGRALTEVGAHVEGHNTGNLGICLIGNDQFTQKQFDALRGLLDELLKTELIPRWEIYCHRDWDTAQKQGKTCPNMKVTNLLYWYYLKDQKAIASYLLPT